MYRQLSSAASASPPVLAPDAVEQVAERAGSRAVSRAPSVPLLQESTRGDGPHKFIYRTHASTESYEALYNWVRDQTTTTSSGKRHAAGKLMPGALSYEIMIACSAHVVRASGSNPRTAGACVIHLLTRNRAPSPMLAVWRAHRSSTP